MTSLANPSLDISEKPLRHLQKRCINKEDKVDQNFINSTTPRESQSPEKKAKVIKRYGNRKLYDTEQSSYVVLNDIAKMIRNEEEVRVIDNETKDDITSATLTQIIFGAEKKSLYSAPLNVLKSIIKKGDGSFSNFLAEIGLFKAKTDSTKSMIERERKKAVDSVYYSNKGENNKVVQQKSIQDRIVNAALDPNSTDNEKTILPTAKNNF